jgi:hypothetical protein
LWHNQRFLITVLKVVMWRMLLMGCHCVLNVSDWAK